MAKLKGKKMLVVEGIHAGAIGIVVYEDRESAALFAPDWPRAWYEMVYEKKVHLVEAFTPIKEVGK